MQEEPPGTIQLPPPAQTQKQTEGINPKNTDMALDQIAEFYHLDVNKPHDQDRVRLARDFPNLTPQNQYMVLAFLMSWKPKEWNERLLQMFAGKCLVRA